MSDAEMKAAERREQERKEQGAREDGPKPHPSDGQEEESDDGPSVAATMDGPSKREDLSDLHAAWIGGTLYRVWSERSGYNAYKVDLEKLSCTCEHGEHNHSTTEACMHLKKSIMCHHANPDLEFSVMMEYAQNLRDANTMLNKAQDALGAMRSAQEAYEAEVAAGNNPGAAKPADSDPDTSGGEQAKAEEAAERLKSAFDEHIEEMNVKAENGLVWFQTGKDTPDEWPYPGFSETFKAVTSPDCVAYVYSDDPIPDWADGPHKWNDKRPSKWFKNALEPGDVDEYIEELGL